MAASYDYGPKWWTNETVAVVTGANKGIGYDIARILAEQGVRVVACARDDGRGTEAVEKLRKGLGEAGAELVQYRRLDIADPESIEEFGAWAEATFPGGIPILVNNAAFAYKGNIFGADEAAATLRTNYHGTAQLTERLRPLVLTAAQRGGPGAARVVTVSSTSGLSQIVRDPSLKDRFMRATKQAEVDALAHEFVDAIRAGRHSELGWPNSMYGISKLCVNSWNRILGEELRPHGVMANCMHPGYCATDMSSWRGTRSSAEGADTAVWLALRPPQDFVTGRFWADRGEMQY